MTSPSNPAEHQPVVAVLERYYTAILGPFEEAYRKNIVEQQLRPNTERDWYEKHALPPINGKSNDWRSKRDLSSFVERGTQKRTSGFYWSIRGDPRFTRPTRYDSATLDLENLQSS